MAQITYFQIFISVNLWITCFVSSICGQDIPDEQAGSDGCLRGAFECSNGACLPPRLVCDGTDDCGDNSDESDCSRGICADDFYRCDNGNCIINTLVCDMENDCGDNSDEGQRADCPDDGSAINRTCSFAHFQCDNEQCIPVRFKCNHSPECLDGSDEDTGMCTGHRRKGGRGHASKLSSIGFYGAFLAFVAVRVIDNQLIQV